MQLILHPPYSNGKTLWVGGMLWNRPQKFPKPGRWRLFTIWHHIHCKPLSKERIEISVGNGTSEVETDEFGAFQVELPIQGDEKKLIAMVNGQQTEADIHYILPGDNLVISDVDDTLLHTKVYHRLIRILEFLRQDPFRKTAVPELKEMLEHVEAQTSKNSGKTHFLYVSNSEWNLLPFLRASFKFHQVPEGLFFLSRYRKWQPRLLKFKVSQTEKKYQRILNFLDNTSKLNLWLIGDTGQNDVWHYLKVAKRYPKEIKEVVFRAHKPSDGIQRFKKIKKLFSELNINTKLYPE